MIRGGGWEEGSWTREMAPCSKPVPFSSFNFTTFLKKPAAEFLVRKILQYFKASRMTISLLNSKEGVGLGSSV